MAAIPLTCPGPAGQCSHPPFSERTHMSDPTRSDRPVESSCPDCDSPRQVGLPSRRDVLKRAAGGAVVASAASAGLFSLVVRPRAIQAAEAVSAAKGAASETLV